MAVFLRVPIVNHKGQLEQRPRIAALFAPQLERGAMPFSEAPVCFSRPERIGAALAERVAAPAQKPILEPPV
jgi:hypothetical protein